MVTIGIMANGPQNLLPDLTTYKKNVDIWIGADRGALTLINCQIDVEYAVGDFDSINEEEDFKIKEQVKNYQRYPVEKDLTDIEIALLKAFEYMPDQIFLFGVTGGRMDHELINIQLLYSIVKKGIQGIIVDKQNILELTTPKIHHVTQTPNHPNISFVPYSETVKGLTLTGFYYPLTNMDIKWGSTRCISNKLLSNSGTFSYKEGILLIIKSRDDN